ncbi:hypothetical protein RB653_010048 [Dictyostelium firmibasis]|uniref:Uncharacterized protein n=1 Tax=Dictyostelium firmibasis TaxID=79012 RepID=A0AAN7TSJ6_9MYCE
MGDCTDIMETNIGQCTLNKCNHTTSFKIAHVTGNLYEIYLYNKNCETGINYSFINCSTIPISNQNEKSSTSSQINSKGIEVKIDNTKISLSKFNTKVYCFNEMSQSSNDDDFLQLNNFNHNSHLSSNSNSYSKYNFLTFFSYLLILLII